MDGKTKVVVVGGGLAGLAAATYAARAGHAVTVLEKARAPGGRAATHDRDGYLFNIGPHAVYRGGAAAEVLADLGVAYRGAPPPSAGYALDGDAIRVLPTGMVSLLTTSLLPLGAKLEAARFLGSIGAIDAGALASTSTADLIASRARSPEARRLLGAIFRVSTYVEDHERLSAGAAVLQLQSAIRRGVIYLDGGWETLVRGIRAAAEAAGVTITTDAKAEAVDRSGGAVRGVRLAGGRTIAADGVILAVAPEVARALCADVPAIAAWAEAVVPSKASCLDVALSRLPSPRRRLALGTDRPLYFSVHSSVARLAPPGGAVIHLARYGHSDDPAATERELEGVLDRMQPGWREALVHRRFLPAMTVAHDTPQAARGGLVARARCEVPGAPGIALAGDWVGPEGMLADAALASARAAARVMGALRPGKTRLEATALAG